jgi:hypothetical protein
MAADIISNFDIKNPNFPRFLLQQTFIWSWYQAKPALFIHSLKKISNFCRRILRKVRFSAFLPSSFVYYNNFSKDSLTVSAAYSTYRVNLPSKRGNIYHAFIQVPINSCTRCVRKQMRRAS